MAIQGIETGSCMEQGRLTTPAILENASKKTAAGSLGQVLQSGPPLAGSFYLQSLVNSRSDPDTGLPVPGYFVQSFGGLDGGNTSLEATAIYPAPLQNDPAGGWDTLVNSFETEYMAAMPHGIYQCVFDFLDPSPPSSLTWNPDGKVFLKIISADGTQEFDVTPNGIGTPTVNGAITVYQQVSQFAFDTDAIFGRHTRFKVRIGFNAPSDIGLFRWQGSRV